MGVSKNRGTPKSSISNIFTIHFGGPALFLVQHPYMFNPFFSFQPLVLRGHFVPFWKIRSRTSCPAGNCHIFFTPKKGAISFWKVHLNQPLKISGYVNVSFRISSTPLEWMSQYHDWIFCSLNRTMQSTELSRLHIIARKMKWRTDRKLWKVQLYFCKDT